MKALIDIPEEANRTLNILKAQMGFKNKSETITYVVRQFEDTQPELRSEFIKKMQRIEKGKFKRYSSVKSLRDEIENA